LKTKNKIIALLLFFIIGVSIFLLFKKDEDQRIVSLTPPLHISGKDVAHSAEIFLRSFTREDKSYNQKICNRVLGSCEFSGEARLPVFAWRIAAFSALWSAQKKQAYLDQVSEDLFQMIQKTDGLEETWSLHLLQSAYPHLSGTSVRESVRNTIINSSRIVRDVTLQRYLERREEVTHFSSMFTFTMVHQLAGIADFILKANDSNDDELLELLSRSGVVAKNASVEDAVSYYLDLAKEVYRNGVSEFTDLESADALESSCWMKWAQVRLYDLTKDEDSFSEVKSFFSQGSISGFPDFSFSFDKLYLTQSYAVCLSALQSASQYAPDLNELYLARVQDLLVKAWDSENRPLCVGDNGFFSRLGESKESDVCASKNVNDTALLAYVLSQDKNIYEIK
jgi:hypothetical protein